MDISLRTATEAGDYMSHNMTQMDQMLQIDQTPEGQRDPAAIKVFDHNRRGVNRYDQQFHPDEKSFETTYSDGKSSFINNGK